MKPIFLISHQRSGTNALRGTLLLHDKIADCGESFNVEGSKYAENYFHFLRLDDNRRLLDPGASRRRFLKYYEYLSSYVEKPIGILDIKYDALRLFDPESHELGAPPALFHLINEVNGSVVHLVRNPFHIYVSHQVAVLSGVWHVRAGGRAVDGDMRIQIDTDDMLFYVRRRSAERQSVVEFGRHCPHRLMIDYRDIFPAEAPPDFGQIWQFLGLTPMDIEMQLRKSITRPYPDLIANYDQVAASLRGAGLGDLLEEA